MNITQNAVSFIITGTNFNTRAGANLVYLSSGTAKVTAQTSTQLTITFLTQPNLGPLYAVIKNPRKKSTKVRVATVVAGIVVTPNSDSRAINAPTLVIAGTGFSATANQNTVTFNLGAVGTVTSATTTQLTVTFSTQPTTTGSLTAVVAVSTSNGDSGTAVEVATIVAVATVTENLTVIPRNVLAIYYAGPPPTASYFTRPFIIYGTGFNPTANQNTVIFNKAAVGTVTAATATELTVEFALTSYPHLTNYPTSNGALTVSVECFGSVSNTATIATVVANSIVYPNEANALYYYNNLDLLYQGISAPYTIFTFGGESDPVLIRYQNINLPITFGSVSAEVKKNGTLNINVNDLAGYSDGYFEILYYEFISVGNYETPVIVYDFTGTYGQSFSTSSTNDISVFTNDIIVIHANLDEVQDATYNTIYIDLYFTD